MTRIPLTDKDMIGMDEPQYSGWVLKLSENMAEAEIKFKQILDDYEFVEGLGDGWKDIIKFVRETKKENKQLKEMPKRFPSPW